MMTDEPEGLDAVPTWQCQRCKVIYRTEPPSSHPSESPARCEKPGCSVRYVDRLTPGMGVRMYLIGRG